MDDKMEDIEIDLEASQKPENQEQEDANDSGADPDLLEKSYMEKDSKKPQIIFLCVIILLITFVFFKKYMASKIDNKPFQVVEDLMKDNVKGK